MDRRRGWWTDSQSTIILHSTMTPVSAPQGRPMQVHMKISQHIVTSAR